VIVIGAGYGGFDAAKHGADHGLKVAIVEYTLISAERLGFNNSQLIDNKQIINNINLLNSTKKKYKWKPLTAELIPFHNWFTEKYSKKETKKETKTKALRKVSFKKNDKLT